MNPPCHYKSHFGGLLLFLVISCPTVWGQIRRFDVFRETGGRIDWDWTRNNIAFDARGTAGKYEIFTRDGCLTCGLGLPVGHRGGPAWIPGGRWLLFQAQNRPSRNGTEDYFATPGIGLNNDIWALDFDSHRVLRIYKVKEGQRLSGLRVSRDGLSVCWTESGRGIRAVLPSGEPRLTGIHTWRLPEELTLNALEDWLPDGELLISAAKAGQDVRNTLLYACRINRRVCRQLPGQPGGHNDFARVSTSGKRLLWASTEGGWQADEPNDYKTDLWLMDLDKAKGKVKRMTWFNEPANPHYLDTPRHHGARVTSAAWGPDGKTLIALVVIDARGLEQRLLRMEFPEPE